MIETRPATGWAAVSKHGEILILTVSSTERGARINWLWTEGKLPFDGGEWSDWRIAEAFKTHGAASGARIERVTITPTV